MDHTQLLRIYFPKSLTASNRVQTYGYRFFYFFNVLARIFRVPVLRLFLKSSTHDWLFATVRILSVEALWDGWRGSFVDNFNERDWFGIVFA